MDLLLLPFISDKEWELKQKNQVLQKLNEAETQIQMRNEALRTIMTNIIPVGVVKTPVPNPNPNTTERGDDESDTSTQADLGEMSSGSDDM